jgi:kynureninase
MARQTPIGGHSFASVSALDEADVLRSFRARFALPENVVYLDGGSLGALPSQTIDRVVQVTRREWGDGLIRSWNASDWINSPFNVGAKIARLIGAEPDEVVVADSTSINAFRLVLAALTLQTERTEVLTEAGNFPTDVYICEGAVKTFGRNRRLRLVPRENLLESISESTAVILLTHVHYKTSEIHDMARITRCAHEAGALVIWDLSHTVGALPVDLNSLDVDFAVGCGYKYLNGGPGAPSFLFVARRHQGTASNAMSAWMGHARPFDFTDEYVAASGIRRFLSGTPSVVANSMLDVGVDLVLEAGVARLAEKSRRLSELFIDLIESTCAGYGLRLVSPRDARTRGSHVAIATPHGYEIMQALIERSVIGDFRAPDVIRFCFTPLYTSFRDIWRAVQTLREILEGGHWREPRYAVRAAVT